VSAAEQNAAHALAELRGLVELLRAEVLELRVAVGAQLRGKQGLDAGRAKANREKQKQAAGVLELIMRLWLIDVREGRPRRGRGKRIAYGLTLTGHRLSVSQVNKKLRALSSARSSAASNSDNDQEKGR